MRDDQLVPQWMRRGAVRRELAGHRAVFSGLNAQIRRGIRNESMKVTGN